MQESWKLELYCILFEYVRKFVYSFCGSFDKDCQFGIINTYKTTYMQYDWKWQKNKYDHDLIWGNYIELIKTLFITLPIKANYWDGLSLMNSVNQDQTPKCDIWSSSALLPTHPAIFKVVQYTVDSCYLELTYLK